MHICIRNTDMVPLHMQIMCNSFVSTVLTVNVITTVGWSCEEAPAWNDFTTCCHACTTCTLLEINQGQINQGQINQGQISISSGTKYFLAPTKFNACMLLLWQYWVWLPLVFEGLYVTSDSDFNRELVLNYTYTRMLTCLHTYVLTYIWHYICTYARILFCFIV